MVHKLIPSFQLVFCLYSTVYSSQISGHENTNLPRSSIHLAKNSYLGHWMQVSENLQQMNLIRNNQTLKEDLEDTLEELVRLRSLGDVYRRHNTKLKMLEDEDPSVMVQKFFKELTLKYSNQTISQCINDTGRVLIQLFDKTYYAEQMFDSIGKPGPSVTLGRAVWVGNYDQCRSAYAPPDSSFHSKGFKGQYIVLPFYLHRYITASWGLCFPDTCKEVDVYMLFNDIKSHFKTIDIALGFPAILNDERPFTTATYAAIVIISFIVFWMIIGTLYDVLIIQRPKWEAQKKSSSSLPVNRFEESNGYQRIVENGHHASNGYGSVEQNGKTHSNIDHHQKTPSNSKQAEDTGIMHKVLISFSVYTNTTKFLNTRIPPGTLGAIHGIRFLSMSWVVLGHMFAFGSNYFANRETFQANVMQRWTFDAVSNALVSVDTFFTLSGLLTAYLTVKEMKKKQSAVINWGLFYFHRFWRLTPPYMLTLTIALGLQQFMGSGAIWSPVQPADKEGCEDNWWTNLLYVNNVVNLDKGCFGHAWYLANDMQFFILSPLMMVPFFFNNVAGIISCMVFLIVHWITTGVLSHDKEWPATFFSTVPSPGIESFMDKYYVKPWCRIGPYVVGILTGALLANNKIKLNKISNAIGWVVFTAMGLAIVYGLRGDIGGKHPLTNEVRAFYNAVGRSAWGVCVCWVIVSCVKGYGGFVNSILTFSPFVSLGRLTYMAYLVHPTIIYSYYGNLDSLMYINDFNIIIAYLGMLALVNMTAFVFMLGLESPMIGLEKAIIPRRRD